MPFHLLQYSRIVHRFRCSADSRPAIRRRTGRHLGTNREILRSFRVPRSSQPQGVGVSQPYRRRRRRAGGAGGRVAVAPRELRALTRLRRLQRGGRPHLAHMAVERCPDDGGKVVKVRSPDPVRPVRVLAAGQAPAWWWKGGEEVKCGCSQGGGEEDPLDRLRPRRRPRRVPSPLPSPIALRRRRDPDVVGQPADVARHRGAGGGRRARRRPCGHLRPLLTPRRLAAAAPRAALWGRTSRRRCGQRRPGSPDVAPGASPVILAEIVLGSVGLAGDSASRDRPYVLPNLAAWMTSRTRLVLGQLN
eukprot:gene7074-biopygen7538